MVVISPANSNYQVIQNKNLLLDEKNSIQITNKQKVAFKGDTLEYSSDSYKSHSGLKTGAVYGAIVTVLNAIALTMNLSSINQLEASGADKKVIEAAKSQFKDGMIQAPLLLGVALACGAIVDAIGNKKRAEFDEETKGQSSKDIFNYNDSADITRMGNVYYKSNNGKKWGTLLGVFALPLANFNTIKKSPAMGIGCMIFGALGGLILGSITDHYTNKNAAKKADMASI